MGFLTTQPVESEDETPLTSDSESDDHDDQPSMSAYTDEPKYIPRKVVNLNTELGMDNLGYGLLLKMGWKGSGVGLGVDGKGRTEPIPIKNPTPGLGIGKLNQDTKLIDEVVMKGRRDMESERWAGLSVEEKAKGAEAEAKRSEVKKEIADTLKAF